MKLAEISPFLPICVTFHTSAVILLIMVDLYYILSMKLDDILTFSPILLS